MMNILTFQELKEKLNTSFEKYDTMIIQEQISGDEFRILVLFSEVIICINRVPATIVGNGKDTIEQRIKEENRNNPLRGEEYDAPLAYIPIDEEMKSYIGKQ
jgi:D-alanine-D-alanine ligase-like ATP-grasp enzyme